MTTTQNRYLPLSIEWRNFRGFEQVGPITIKPLTVIIGPNNSGKSALIAPLLLLKQTLESQDPAVALRLRGELIDAGSFAEVAHRHRRKSEVEFILTMKEPLPLPDDASPALETRPNTLHIAFRESPHSEWPELSKFCVLDGYGRPILERRLRSNSNRKRAYSLRHIKLNEDIKDDTDKFIAEQISQLEPMNFLFTNHTITAGLIDYQMEKLRESNTIDSSGSNRKSGPAKRSKIQKFHLSPTSANNRFWYMAATNFIESSTDKLLRSISYLGPLRDPPKRIYETISYTPYSSGPRGEWTPHIIHQMGNDEIVDEISHWLDALGISREMRTVSHPGANAFSIKVKRRKNSPAISLADTGFGLSQVLPIVTEAIRCQRTGDILICEQPEIHLNPKMQVGIAELFASVAMRGAGVIIETHSEHIVLALRRLIAEKKINPELVTLLYVEKVADSSYVRTVPIQNDGHIRDEDWPRHFFDQGLQEAFKLATAQFEGENNA